MSANSFSALAPTNFMPMVQDFLNNMMVSKPISRTEFRKELKSGQAIDFPYITDLYVQDYIPGTDMTIPDGTATSDTMSINKSRSANFKLDPNQQAQAEDKSIQAKLARQAAYRIANDVDQKLFTAGVDAAGGTVAGGALAANNINQYLSESRAALSRSNGADGRLYAVVDPDRIALLSQAFISAGFGEADTSLRNGFSGRALGFDVYESNNLPTTSVFTCPTIPTATDTFTICGVTWTCVADGSAAAAGEINVGANVADFKGIFLLAMAGTTSADYVDVSAEDRLKIKNSGLAASAWVGNDCTLTAFGKQGNTETFTPVGDVFGTETGQCLIGRQGATSLGMQIQPTMYVGKEAKRPESNYMVHTLYGTKVYHQDINRLVKLTMEV